MKRRKFLKGGLGTRILAGLSPALLTSSATAATPDDWDSGIVQHILPTVSDTRMLIKISLASRFSDAPVLFVDNMKVQGQMNDTQGEFWQFYAQGLEPGKNYTLQLKDSSENALCEHWDLATFPDEASSQETFRVLMYTCAGGDERLNVRSNDIRRRLLRRGLSYRPQAVAAIGDHIYWGLPNAGPGLGSGRRRANRAQATGISQEFGRVDRVFGTDNEALLKLVASPQIVPIYGTDFRSTPVFFSRTITTIIPMTKPVTS